VYQPFNFLGYGNGNAEKKIFASSVVACLGMSSWEDVDYIESVWVARTLSLEVLEEDDLSLSLRKLFGQDDFF
jgi:hypothetical protein